MSQTRDARRADLRERILRAAGKLLQQEGPDALSLRAVARAVDYSPAGLYAHFDSREALLEALRQRAEDRLRQSLAAALAAPAEHPLLALGEAVAAFACSRPADLDLLLRAGPPPAALALLSDCIEAQIDAGELVPGPGFDTAEMALTVWALAEGLSAQARRGGLSAPQRQEALRRLLAGLRA